MSHPWLSEKPARATPSPPRRPLPRTPVARGARAPTADPLSPPRRLARLPPLRRGGSGGGRGQGQGSGATRPHPRHGTRVGEGERAKGKGERAKAAAPAATSRGWLRAKHAGYSPHTGLHVPACPAAAGPVAPPTRGGGRPAAARRPSAPAGRGGAGPL